MKKLLILTTILASLGVPWASADVEVRIISGSGDTGWIDCLTPLTSCATGLMVVGNYNVASDIAIQNDGMNPFLDVSYDANTHVAGAGSITFEAIANGYNAGFLGAFLQGNGNSTLGDTYTLTSYGGNVDTTCVAASKTCDPTTLGMNVLNSVGPNPENLNVTTSTNGKNTVTPYSLGIILTLNSPTTTGGASGDIQLDVAPEPASVMLLGGVLLLTVGGLRRKLGRSA